VITAVDGSPIATANQFQSLIEQARIGQPMQLMVRRGNGSQLISVRTAELSNPG
jgi:S1-C subfamily serine protease